MNASYTRLPCNCKVPENIYTIYERDGIAHCPFCGSYLVNTFLGEKFPKNIEVSPLRMIFKNIIYKHISHKIDGKFIEVKEGPNKWHQITKAIDASHVCFFDISKEIFNVGIELGYALGKRKIIFLGSNRNLSNRVLSSHWLLFKTPSQTQKAVNAVNTILEKMKIKNGKIVEEDFSQQKYTLGIVRVINKLMERFRVINFPDIYNDIYSLIEGVRPTIKNNFLILTSNKSKKYFREVKYIKGYRGDVETPDKFLLSTINMGQFVRGIFGIVERYKGIIVHLLGAPDEYSLVDDVFKYNFKLALLTGFFLGATNRERVLFIKSKYNEYKRSGISFSDIGGNIIDYEKLEKNKIESLIKNNFGIISS